MESTPSGFAPPFMEMRALLYVFKRCGLDV
jgi:hypothetical protein